MMTSHLKIRVTHNGEPKVTITTNADSIENLHELLDDDLQQRIAEQGINLREYVAETRRRCYAPGIVFELQKDAKQVTVSLE